LKVPVSLELLGVQQKWKLSKSCWKIQATSRNC